MATKVAYQARESAKSESRAGAWGVAARELDHPGYLEGSYNGPPSSRVPPPRRFRVQIFGSLGITSLRCFAVVAILLATFSASAQVTFTATELLGRPTGTSVTINIVPGAVVEYYFEYGTVSGALVQQLPTSGFETSQLDVPIEFVIDGLTADTRYYYRMVYREPGDTTWIYRPEFTFHTVRPPGSSFKFLVQADSHMMGITFGQPAFFDNTLANEAAEGADFILDLGDTLAGDETSNHADAVANNVYLRSYFDQVAHSTPLFMVLGNHEGESGWIKDDNPPNNYAIWSTNARKTYYPNPFPDGYYTGSSVVHPWINGDGLRHNYYAWEWGDVLLVTLDPYWYASGFAPSNIWDWSLGQVQYEWLVETLRNSSAHYKFVFTHQVISDQRVGRGGISWISGEWAADSATFAANRPGWAYNISIHDLMVENGVQILFHAHDHFYALEELEGVKYLLIPHPSRSNNGNATNYPLASTLIGSGGHIRVSVTPAEATVEYVGSEPRQPTNGDVVHSFTASPVPEPGFTTLFAADVAFLLVIDRRRTCKRP